MRPLEFVGIRICLWDVRDTGSRSVWRFDGRGLIKFFQGDSESELWDAVDRIVFPVLLVRGEFSTNLLPATAERMLKRPVDGRLAVIAGGGHDVGVEQPEDIAEAV